jgi:hypothetical protein
MIEPTSTAGMENTFARHNPWLVFIRSLSNMSRPSTSTAEPSGRIVRA